MKKFYIRFPQKEILQLLSYTEVLSRVAEYIQEILKDQTVVLTPDYALFLRLKRYLAEESEC